MQFGELFKKLAEKSGIDTNSESFNSVFSQIGNVEIEDAISESFTTNLLSIKEAKNDKSIKGHYFSQFADGLDAELLPSFKTFGISDEKFAELKATEPSTHKRLNLLVKEAKLIADNLVGSDGSKAKKLQEEYESKIEQIRLEKESLAKSNQELLTSFNNERIDWSLEQKLSNQKLNSSLPIAYKNQLAKQVINDYLAKSDAQIILENKELKLKRKSDSSLEFTDFDLDTAVSKALAENGLLEIAPIVTPTVTQTTNLNQNVNSNLSSNIQKIKELKSN